MSLILPYARTPIGGRPGRGIHGLRKRVRGVRLDGSSGTFISTPDHADLDITGDIDIRVVVAMDDWTPSATSTLLAKGTAGSVQPNIYALQVLSPGLSNRLAFIWSADGANELQAFSTVAPTVADRKFLGVRVTLDVDNGASGRDIKFWTKSDLALEFNTGWTQLGATVTQANTTAIANGTGSLRLGERSQTGSLLAGVVRRAVVKNGIDGTIAVDADFSRTPFGSKSVTDLAGKQWTLNGAAHVAAA